MMTAWNTDSGVAIHAEPVGKAWGEDFGNTYRGLS